MVPRQRVTPMVCKEVECEALAWTLRQITLFLLSTASKSLRLRDVDGILYLLGYICWRIPCTTALQATSLDKVGHSCGRPSVSMEYFCFSTREKSEDGGIRHSVCQLIEHLDWLV